MNEDQIHFRYLFTLLVQFVLLILDRALYLRRNMSGKIIFHAISVIALHYWQFHYLQHPTHSVTWPPMLFYFVKCIYFLLSAYQIRCGYPKRVSGNFANNRFTLLHRRVFETYVYFVSLIIDKVCCSPVFSFYFFSHCNSYKRIPFLPEARTLLDWICIKTSLTLKEWFKMEDINSDMFIIKVSEWAMCEYLS